MNLPIVGSINWLWLAIGAVLGWFVLPRLSGMLGV
jgi:hypothetical protein